MPPLAAWLGQFALPSVLAIVATYVALYLTQAPLLRRSVARDVRVPRLSSGGRTAAYGIGGTAVVLLTASALDSRLGLPTCLAGCATAAIVLLRKREPPWPLVKGISWSVLPLVAGLFVLVEGVEQTGVLGH